MHYLVVYDGTCNLCVTLVQALERLDGGQRFRYLPMQEECLLAHWQIRTEDCAAGMILVHPDGTTRWQGAAAAEEIARLLPGGEAVVAAYRGLPGLKQSGDRCYIAVRDHRYQWFGGRPLYRSPFAPEVSPALLP